jgi:GNAT superfamily N-acetyltransferase
MGIDLVPFAEGDEAAARRAWEISRAAWAVTAPDIPHESLNYFLSALRNPAPGYDFERAIANLDGEPAGYLMFRLPTLDNLENAEAEIWVVPERRRRGVGTALFEYAADRLRALGRKRIFGETVGSRPGGPEFCAALGASAALDDTRSHLDVTTVDRGRLDAMLAEAWTHADGYRTLRWQGMPAEEYLADVAYLDGRMVTDAPMGDLDWEPEKVDAERIREDERRRLARGIERFHTGAIHVASGRMVGFTTLGGDREIPTHLWQNNTIVDPLHRGHRLGTILKLENFAFALAHRPETTGIDTFNATSNEYMLSINRAMGFRAADAWIQWQKTV